MTSGLARPSLSPTLLAQAAIDQVGFKPDVIAQSLRRNNTRTTGLIVDDISVSGYPEYVGALQSALHERGYTLVLGSTSADIQTENEILSSFVQRRADGVVVTSGARENASFYEGIVASGIPAVLVERDKPLALDRVLVDHASGIREATRYLLVLGHRRIALITGPPEVTPARTCSSGFLQAFSEVNLQPEKELIQCGAFSAAFGLEIASTLLARETRPSAIIAGGNLMLPGVIRAIRQAGLRIPADVSVVAVSDSPLAELSEPPIAVVRWSFHELGELAASLLLSRIESIRVQPRQLTVSTEFLPRGSCAPLVSADYDTAVRIPV
jgi:LacI family transcriptional regulator